MASKKNGWRFEHSGDLRKTALNTIALKSTGLGSLFGTNGFSSVEMPTKSKLRVD